MRDKNIAALMAFFVGGLGAHRFYLGQPGLGMLYLVFCWTPIPWVLGLLEFTWLALMDPHVFQQRFNGMYLLSQGGVGYPMLQPPSTAPLASPNAPRALRPVQSWEPPPVTTSRASRPQVGSEPFDPTPLLRDLDRRRELGEVDDNMYQQEKRRILDTYS